MSQCTVPGCMGNNDGKPYSGLPCCMQPWAGDPAVWEEAHKGCVMRNKNPIGPAMTQQPSDEGLREILAATFEAGNNRPAGSAEFIRLTKYRGVVSVDIALAAMRHLLEAQAAEREVLDRMRRSAFMLLRSTEAGFTKHHAVEFQDRGYPGWLRDCRATIEAGARALAHSPAPTPHREEG